MIELNVTKGLLSESGAIELKVDLKIAKGDFATIFGISGSGKTTTLRMLAGLTDPDDGRISVGGEVWFDRSLKVRLPPQRRRIGYVFQDYALFPHLSVRKNLTYALEDKKDSQWIDALLEMTGLVSVQDRLPGVLSGGQRQRVALARALVRRPQILLLDEPLSALDMDMRRRLQDQLLEIHRKLGLTTLLVSHDLSEVFRTSNIVYIMETGRITRSGPPGQVFMDRKISGKFRFTGEVLEITKEDVIFVVAVLVGNTVISVIAVEDEIRDLNVGDRVMVGSKAMNPLLFKI